MTKSISSLPSSHDPSTHHRVLASTPKIKAEHHTSPPQQQQHLHPGAESREGQQHAEISLLPVAAVAAAYIWFLLRTKIRRPSKIGAPPEHRYTNLQLLGSAWTLKSHTQGWLIKQKHKRAPVALATRRALSGTSANTVLWCKVKDTRLHGDMLCPFFGIPG